MRAGFRKAGLSWIAAGVVAVALVTSAYRAPVPRPEDPYCFSSTESLGPWFLAEMREYGSSRDSGSVAYRAKFDLPYAKAKDIVAITDEATCKRASIAIDSSGAGDHAGAGIYLVRIGRHYMAFTPGKHGLIIHLDANFKVLNAIMQLS